MREGDGRRLRWEGGSSEDYEGWEVERRRGCDGNGVGTRENREGMGDGKGEREVRW
jgi:hypothetical protein